MGSGRLSYSRVITDTHNYSSKVNVNTRRAKAIKMNRGQMRGNQIKIKEHKVLVDQLKRELAVSRVKVSETTKELIKYIQEHKDNDPLLKPQSGGGSKFCNFL